VYVVITYLPSGKLEIGPRSTSPVSTPSPLNGDGRADEGAEPDRRGAEEGRPVEGLELLLRRPGRLGGLLVLAGAAPDQVAHPEPAEEDGDDGPHDEHPDGEHEPDEHAGDADREPDRPQARRGEMLVVV
jgi:hypothetical protein